MFEFDGQHRVFGVTALENLFITEYMPGADGDYVKVYLSALYHCQQQDGSFGIPEMALELGLGEDRIEAALRYWERRRLLTRVSDNPLRYTLYHLGERMLTGQDAPGGDRDYIAFAEAIYALFQNRRKIRPSEIAMAFEWVSEMHLPQEVVMMLLTYCMDTRGVSFTFKAAQKLAATMAEDGVKTPEDAEQYLSHSKHISDGAKAVLRRFNMRRLPTEDELRLYRLWTQDWGFTHDGILAACAETVKASNPSFGYLNGILEGLRRRGASGRDAKQVEQQIAQESKGLAGAREVLDALGTRTSATLILKAYEALLQDAPHELIVLAARDVAARRGRFEDIEKRLKAWREQGITTAEAAAKSAPTPATGGRQPKTVSAQRYAQREYTGNELSEREAKMLEEARKYDQP